MAPLPRLRSAGFSREVAVGPDLLGAFFLRHARERMPRNCAARPTFLHGSVPHRISGSSPGGWSGLRPWIRRCFGMPAFGQRLQQERRPEEPPDHAVKALVRFISSGSRFHGSGLAALALRSVFVRLMGLRASPQYEDVIRQVPPGATRSAALARQGDFPQRSPARISVAPGLRKV